MTPVLDVRDVHLRRGTREILRGVSFSADPGDIVVVMGLSGSGRRRFFARSPDSSAATPAASASKAAARAWCSSFIASSNICRRSTTSASRRYTRIMCAARTRCGARTNCWQRSASSTVRPRCRVSCPAARRRSHRARLRGRSRAPLLDQPTASLDPERRTELGALLTALAREGRTLVVATHDEEFARACATRTLRLVDGMLV